MRALDTALPGPARLVIIGGSAAALGYGYDRATRDIDTFESVSPTLRQAFEAARIATSLEVYMDQAAIACPPYNWEDRLVKVEGVFARLQLYVPDPHDLVLMKLERAAPPDIDAAICLRDQGRLDADVLVERYRNEMAHCVGDPTRRRQLFLYSLARLFDSSTATRAEKLLS